MKIPGLKHREHYIAIVCERCKECALVEEGDYPIPEGWHSFDIGMLCPECTNLYQELRKTFMYTNNKTET